MTTPTVRIALRSRWPVVGVALLAMLAVLLPNRVWTTVGLVLGALLVLSYGWVRAVARGLRVERRLRFRWVAVGDLLEEWYTLVNDSALPAQWVELRDVSNVPGYAAASVRSVGARSTLRWRTQAVCRRRGRYVLGPLTLYLSDPFGLVEASLQFDDRQEIVIHPPVDAPRLAALPQGDGRGQARKRRRSWQTSVSAIGVRPWQPGDPLNRIHWPISARRDTLMVRSFERDSAGDLWLLLDVRAAVQIGQELQGSEEQAILYAAAFGVQTLGGRRAVGLAAYAQTPQLVPPAHATGQRWRLLEALATLRADGTAPPADIARDLCRHARNGSAVLLITPDDSPAWLPALLDLRRAGVAVGAVLLDRVHFGDAAGHSANLLDALQRQEIPATLLGRRDIVLPDHSADRFVVTPLGRVLERAPAA